MNLDELTRIYDFTGQTIVVTGGTGILGGEIACALAGCGANVAILDRNLRPGTSAAGAYGALCRSGDSRRRRCPGCKQPPPSRRRHHPKIRQD